MSEEDEAIQKFRDLINAYKDKYIGTSVKSDAYSQDTLKINNILSYFDEIYTTLFHFIVPHSTNGKSYQNVKIDAKTRDLILLSFMEKGGLRYMKEHPESRVMFKHYLDLDLKKFPFTLKLSHIDELANNNVEPDSGKIIPNEE